MLPNLNQKVVGSIVIGVALVAGAYTLSNFGQPPIDMPAAAITAQAPLRTPITITDEDDNGIEDWRDQLLPPEAATIDVSTSTVEALPQTITGQMSINLIEGFVRSKIQGPFGSSQEELVEAAVSDLTSKTEQPLFDTKDIILMTTWNEDDIRNYANAMALAIQNNSIEGIDQELNVLYDIMVNGKTERNDELVVIAGIYKDILNDSLNIPVPSILLKQHLDLLNSYNALHMDVDAMSQTSTDPALSFMRFKRYLDDAEGLRLSLENMFTALTPYQSVFSSNDSALLFNNFNPNLNRP